MSPPPRPPSSPSGGFASIEARRRAARRTFRRALGVSLVLHLLVLGLYPVVVGPPGAAFLPTGPGESPPPPEGLQLLALRELPPGVEVEPPEPEAPAPREDPEVPSTVPVAPPGAAPRPADPSPGGGPGEEPSEETRRRSAAELLRPPPLDPELFGPLEELPTLTDEERYRLQLAGRLEEWQDSVRAEMERQRRVTDWTHTDAEGNRWGVSPGQIHLGKITLPLPFNFGTPPGRRDEIERRAWEAEDILRGSVRGEILETRQERAREIRARREAERADTLPPPP